MERRFASEPVQIERRAEGEPPKIVGRAAVYYRADDPGTVFRMTGFFGETVEERILPGAFDRAVAEDDVRALVNHEPDNLLGRTTAGTLRLSLDTRGLKYEVDPPDTQLGRDVQVSLGRGDVTGSSFAFEVVEHSWVEQVDPETKQVTLIRELRGVKLYDVGPVTYPAYESTTAGVRSAGLDDLRQAAQAYRERRMRQAARARHVRLLELGL